MSLEKKRRRAIIKLTDTHTASLYSTDDEESSAWRHWHPPSPPLDSYFAWGDIIFTLSAFSHDEGLERIGSQSCPACHGFQIHGAPGPIVNQLQKQRKVAMPRACGHDHGQQATWGSLVWGTCVYAETGRGDFGGRGNEATQGYKCFQQLHRLHAGSRS